MDNGPDGQRNAQTKPSPAFDPAAAVSPRRQAPAALPPMQ
jgi:hypothetical protein